MAFQNVKGMRDFYPPDMRKLNWIIDAWRRVSLRSGFEEYESPVMEYLDLLTAKSGPEIAEQLFNLTDRGGRQLAIRPEMTPSLARMVNAKINALPRPIKWFSISRFCRAENPQKGRGREFYQWNVDVIGEDSELADAECVCLAVEALRQLGLGPGDVVVRYSSRTLLSELMRSLAVPAESVGKAMGAMDKREKLAPDEFEKMLAEAVADQDARQGIVKFLDAGSDGRDIDGSLRQAGLAVTEGMAAALTRLEEFRKALKFFGVEDFCRYDTNIVRGLAYYTGIVYEIFDRSQSLRAVAGGGRYDNLLEALGGPKVSATGLGMGDLVLGILLEDKGMVPESLKAASLDYFVIDGEGSSLDEVVRVVSALRSKGRAADFSYKRQATGKQLQQANRRGAREAIILAAGGMAAVKDLRSGTQRQISVTELLGR